MGRLRERVLVVGLEVAGVESCGWESPIPNLINFDRVIIFLETYPSERSVGGRGPSPLGIERSQLYRQACSDGDRELVFIGDPSLRRVKHELELGQALFPWLSPTRQEHILVDPNSFNANTPYASYLQYVHQSGFSVPRKLASTAGGDAAAEMIRIGRILEGSFHKLSIAALATGYSGDMVAVRVEATRKSGDGAQQLMVTWLPPTSRIDPAEGVSVLIAKSWGIGAQEAPPKWVESFRTPKGAALGLELATANEALELARSRAAEVQSLVAAEERNLQLLYATGDQLHQQVSDVLEVLGASMGQSGSPNLEDLLFDVVGRRWVGEVKGVAGTLKRSYVRQVLDWQNEVWERESLTDPPKALLILNGRRRLAPVEREDVLSPDALSAAAGRGVAVLTTEQLLAALCIFQGAKAGDWTEWDSERWWRTVAESSGACSVPVLNDLVFG